MIAAGFHTCAGKVKRVLGLDETLKDLVKSTLANERSLLIMGRGYQYATCLEGSLVRAMLRGCRSTHAYRAHVPCLGSGPKHRKSKRLRTCTARASWPASSSTAHSPSSTRPCR